MASIYTSKGEEVVVDLIDGASSKVMSSTNAKIGWGTGAGTAAKANTTLFTEAPEARAVGTHTQPTTDKNQWVGTITATKTRAITNAGLFSNTTAGSMVVKGDFATINLSNGDKIEFTITLEQT